MGNTGLNKLSGKKLVLFIDLLGDLPALLCEGECAKMCIRDSEWVKTHSKAGKT